MRGHPHAIAEIGQPIARDGHRLQYRRRRLIVGTSELRTGWIITSHPR
ncbi:hypothetical protein MKAN_14695 [Mycobacterium kansasii ATCC 12478]|uniref:Uncharacterized protein n=1 Tax=Mycobacterium kansasii ATCC 12478 TaxID=557599 RepID=U5WYE2_MYCKA|nr:hypothetical protein MKAN_14695 [Mycobacterium kansasii ATCC 12478]